MRVFLTNVTGIHTARVASKDDWQLSMEDPGAFPPIGLMYLAASIRAKKRHEVTGLDATVEGLSEDAIIRRIVDWGADVVGITTYTPTFYEVLSLSRAIRLALPSVKIVWGGPHTMLFPDESMVHSEVDFLCLGESEENFPKLLDAMEDGSDLSNVPALVYRDGSSIRKTSGPGYIKNINTVPMPDLELLDLTRYRTAIGTGLPAANIITSRGCPYKCTYCCQLYRNYRSRAIEGVLEEMQAYYDRGFREFFFFDDLFNLNAARLRMISEGILSKGFDIQWTFRGRVDGVDDESLRVARKSGCRQALFGVEVATDEDQKSIRKNIRMDQVREAVRLCRRHRIRSSTNWIIGLPCHRSRADVVKLINTAISINSDYAQFGIAIAYHGTEMFDEGVRRGIIDGDVWRKYSLDPRPTFLEPIWEEYMNRSELSNLYKYCFRRFYFRPMTILSKILRIRRWNELLLHARGAITLLGLRR